MATVDDAVKALKAYVNSQSPESLTTEQVKDIVRSVDWSVPENRNLLLYSGGFQDVAGGKVTAWKVRDALKAAAPENFFTDEDTGMGQVLNQLADDGESWVAKALRKSGVFDNGNYGDSALN